MGQTIFPCVQGIPGPVCCESTAFGDFAQAELGQVIGFELAAGPAVSLFKLNSENVVCISEFAVFY
jgi:hypothetical protein